MGAEVAEKLADRLGYRCVAREVLLEASEEFNVEEAKLLHAVHDAPGFFERMGKGRQRYIAFIQTALLRHLKLDDVVYHGLAGHYFVRDVPHVIKVRILADLEERIGIVMSRDGVSRKDAEALLHRNDEERRRWGKHMYGIDPADPCLYDLVLHIRNLRTEDAVEVLAQAAKLPSFQSTPESQQKIEDLALAAEVRAVLVDTKPDIEVVASRGEVKIGVRENLMRMESVLGEIRAKALSVNGVDRVEVEPEFTPTLD